MMKNATETKEPLTIRPNTYTQIYIQIVFAVKGRQNFIEEQYREELQKYLTGIIQNRLQKLLTIYCMPDHVHLFIGLKPNMTISNLVRDIKSLSSPFISERLKFNWQEGFGAFSYSKSQIDQVVKYILNQKSHHQKLTFKEEYIEFLKKFEIEYLEKYLFEWYD
ncbi:MAG: IS200/IS605 family transposase [Bacteroidia bacterium]|nr:IS200/IS605 family transposase [Bacteroidia bacterium]